MSAETPVPVEGATLTFAALGLPAPLLEALAAVGYETPSPIQAATIPHLLTGRDVLGQAQTGTGKTAAFALPLLARIDATLAKPQALILAPTRELAIQVAEALQKYAARLPGFHVLPIYGGQSYQPQLAALKRGVHVIVGTPGRVIDHLDRGSLKLDQLKTLVLDEADEMLRMGFIDDVEKILQQTPAEKQVALFSATMPPPIKRIASTYLREPAEVSIAASTKTATTVRQRCLIVSPHAKLDALTRILEVEPFDGLIIFTRTKIATEELADKLSARGYSAAALNGDIQQQQRERTVNKLKDGGLDIVVATDVAARGLDVERVSHVINYDVPTDPESYVHRIGRTGRAGREGDAILFISPRERGLLKMIERTTRKHIEMMGLPSDSAINAKRTAKFQAQVVDTLKQTAKLTPMRELVAQLEQELGREQGASLHEIAAALALMAQGGKSLLLSGDSAPAQTVREHSFDRSPRPGHAGERSSRPESFSKKPFRKDEGSTGERPSFKPPFAGAEERPSFRPPAPPISRSEGAAKPFRERPAFADRDEAPRAKRPAKSDEGMETFRIEVGHQHGVLPKNIVGAIANEADIESKYMGRIDIRDDHSLIDLPEGMPKEVFEKLKKVWVAGQRLSISRVKAGEGEKPAYKKSFSKPKPRYEG
ncbi:DEAD/DEAH box helicase [Stagnimonas aquatica]|uniref:ATP-dependent RNA helicase DeaD n=1 Tax=Stagnimonas aquatica TaxID=2689987 RepID=A0A3N0UYR3_9GAMM|nr:DEAD/DEAH box helicase [Stagnimonas aquatica]ROH85623.1 DEAD/DEAH box helicase [Stagnimonas aquatica]